MIQCCRSDFVLEVNLSNKAAAVLSLTSRTSAPHLLYSTGWLQGRNHCSSIWKTCKTSRKADQLADQYTSRPALSTQWYNAAAVISSLKLTYRIKQLRYCRSPQGRQHRICFIRQVDFKDEITAAAFLYSPHGGCKKYVFTRGKCCRFFLFCVFGRRFLRDVWYNFHEILMSFWCHFWIILASFWCHFGVILVPRPQNAARTWLLSILAPFWGAFGGPWGTFLEAFWAFTSVVGPPRRQIGSILGGLLLKCFFEWFLLSFWVGPGCQKHRFRVRGVSKITFSAK